MDWKEELRARGRGYQGGSLALARAMGITASHFYFLLSGKRGMNWEMKIRLVSVFPKELWPVLQDELWRKVFDGTKTL